MKQNYWEQILTEAARHDPDYQDLLERCREAEGNYLLILERLPQLQREQLEDYITLCEALEHRLTVLALELPRE